jgi:hypothetical protein
MTASEAYKNKHGLHKKPPTQTTQNVQVELVQDENEINASNDKQYYDSMKTNMAPRLSPLRRLGDPEVSRPKKKVKVQANRVKKMCSFPFLMLIVLH